MKDILLKEIDEMKFMINKLIDLKEKMKEKEESIKRVETFYKYNIIDEKEYKRLVDSLKSDLIELETKYLEILGMLSEKIRELKKLIEFKKGLEEIPKVKPRMEITEIPREIESIINVFPEVQVVQIKQAPTSIITVKEIKEEKRKVPVISKKALQFYRILMERRKEKQRKEKVEIRRRKMIQKFEISYIQLANRLFGRFAEQILKRFPDLYLFIYRILKMAGVRMLVRTYLAIFLFLFFVFLMILIPLIILTILISRNFLIVILSLIIAFSIFSLLFFYYPNYIRKEKEQSIKAALPFVIIQMSALAQAGLNIKDIFRIIAEMEEYKHISEEFKRIVDYINLGLSISDAIKKVADETPSQELRDFLNGLLLALRSGASLREYLEISAQSAIINYKSLNQKFIQAIKTFSDIYVGMVVTAPMILIAIIIMLSSLAQNIFGISIPLLTYLLVYLFVPVLNITMLLLISKIQPK